VTNEAPTTEDEVDVETPEAPAKYRLSLDVEMKPIGPCKKHVRIRIPRLDIEHFQQEAVKEVSGSAAVPGFRVGHVPVKLVERRFKKELSDQVRQRLLLESLEQLADDKSLDPINQPEFDFESLAIPEEGDFEYEFDVEVRPEFDLPNYSGLQIKRPTRTITEEDVQKYKERFLRQYGTFIPKETPAEPGDHLVLDLEFAYAGGETPRPLTDVTVELKPTLRFPDAEFTGFDKLMAGVVPGDTRTANIVISQEAEAVEMRGESLSAVFHVKEVNSQQLPELTREFLDRIGFEAEEDLETEIMSMLNRQTQYEQRQSTRTQVLEKITESAKWDLPEELVKKQVENALYRELLEMQQAGFTTAEIRSRENEIRQRSISNTRQALKEHFVLDKIATTEKIEVTPVDIEAEIQMMAIQRGENPRRVRARLQKSGVIENLEAQIRERKAVDFILKHAKFQDVPMEASTTDNVTSIAVPICGRSASVTEAHDHDHDHDGDHDHDHG
jgi:trigger factor